MEDTHRRPWFSVITGGESLVSHAGGVLLMETARRSGLARERRPPPQSRRSPLPTAMPHPKQHQQHAPEISSRS